MPEGATAPRGVPSCPERNAIAGRVKVPARSRGVRRERFAMRYPKDQKQATRQRILGAAGRRFKPDGIEAPAVAAVMSDARLTNRGFYAPFASKEDLVAHVL